MTKFASFVIASMLAATPVLAQTTAPTAPAATMPQAAPAAAKQAIVVKHGHRHLRLSQVRAECRAEARAEGLKGRFGRHAIVKCERAKFAFHAHKQMARVAHKSLTKNVTKMKG